MSSVQAESSSTFITVVAWIFIVLSGLGVLMASMQNIVIAFMPAMQPPPDAGFVFRHFRLLFLLPWIVSVVSLLSAIGLLKRKEWARKAFIALLSLGVFWTVGSLVVVFFMATTDPAIPDGASEEFRSSARQFESFMIGAQVATTIFSVVIAGLFIWVINRLMQTRIRDEFSA